MPVVNDMRLEYVEVSLDSVMQYYVDGFETKNGEEISSAEWFVDMSKRRVIFKLFIDTAASPASGRDAGEG